MPFTDKFGTLFFPGNKLAEPSLLGCNKPLDAEQGAQGADRP